MATLKQEMIDDVAAVFLNEDEFAESYTRWTNGREAEEEQIVAIWLPKGGRQQSDRGDEVVTEGMIQFSADDTHSDDDIWFIDGIRFAVHETHDTVSGMRYATLRTTDRRRASKLGGR